MCITCRISVSENFAIKHTDWRENRCKSDSSRLRVLEKRVRAFQRSRCMCSAVSRMTACLTAWVEDIFRFVNEKFTSFKSSRRVKQKSRETRQVRGKAVLQLVARCLKRFPCWFLWYQKLIHRYENAKILTVGSSSYANFFQWLRFVNELWNIFITRLF